MFRGDVFVYGAAAQSVRRSEPLSRALGGSGAKVVADRVFRFEHQWQLEQLRAASAGGTRSRGRRAVRGGGATHHAPCHSGVRAV